MTVEHKAALAEGRELSRSVKNYLEALAAHKPKRGRKRTADSIQRRLEVVESALNDADALARLRLLQEFEDLQAELGAMEQKIDPADYEDAFVEAAAVYGERNGISLDTWKKMGVPPAVLRRAGIITRGRASA